MCLAMWLLRTDACLGLPAIKSTSLDCCVMRLIMCACTPNSNCLHNSLLFITSHDGTTGNINFVDCHYSVKCYHL